MTRFLGLGLAGLLTLAGCGDDSAPDDGGTGIDGAVTDSGGGDSGGTDGGAPDGSTPDDGGTGDTGPGPDTGVADSGSSCPDCVEEVVSWGMTGGLTAFERLSEVSPCDAYKLTQMNRDGTTMSCMNTVPCMGDALTMRDLLEALAQADVVAAFEAASSMGGTVLYGRDMRPVDAPIFAVHQGGLTIEVGLDCMGAAGCTPIPEGVAALRTLLMALEDERRAEEDCATVFPGA